MKRKAKVIALLEQGPATTGDVRRTCDCASSAQAIESLKWLEACGIVSKRIVPRIAPTGQKTTTLWSLTTPGGPQA